MFNRPKKIKDFGAFVDELRRKSPAKIVVEAARDDPAIMPWSMSAAVGHLGEYQHSLVYSVDVSGRSKPKVYWEPLFKAFQSQWGIADASARQNRMISVLLAGERRVAELKGWFPEAKIFLGQGNGQPFTEELLEKLHQDAEEHDVSPAV
jgi:hypothetical protein